ncbi:MAG: phosphoenolpyruvate--protein phosphotransferase [Opitutales bacterium]
MSGEEKQKELSLQGIAASPGVAHGPAFVFLQKELEIPVYQVGENSRQREIQRFEDALTTTRTQVTKVRSEVARKLGEDEAQIFDAHLMVLEDRALIEETIHEQEESKFNIEYCFHSVSRRYIEAFGQLDDEYIKERVTDIRDVAKRVLQNLMGRANEGIAKLTDEKVLVSEDLSPSDTADLEKGKILGVVTDAGSKTSHAVIMARSLAVPAVVGLHDATRQIENDDYLLVDGYDGVVIVNPGEQTLFRYGQLRKERQTIQRIFEGALDLPSETSDGSCVGLVANIGGSEDLPEVKHRRAEGIGLFRTESLFIRSDSFPSEEEQYEVYREVAEAMHPHPVIIRTLDLGGDKRMSGYFFAEDEENPFMGFRAIRFCLEHQDVFRDQLRAILRAATVGNVKMMYPMIGSVQELRRANAVLRDAQDELRRSGKPFSEAIEVGSMIEIPSAALIADLLARECDFFSIGTNDLIQYMLAVDRVNDRIAHLYEPNHPAVLRIIQQVIDVGRKANIPVGICGEMAADPIYVPLLFGMGAHDLSVTASSLPEIKYLVRTMRMQEARDLAKHVLTQDEPDEVFKLLRDFYQAQLGDVLKRTGLTQPPVAAGTHAPSGNHRQP